MKRVGLVSGSFVFSFMIVTYGSKCDQPTSPHGSVIIHPSKRGRYRNGEVILFGCKQGFYLNGLPIITCNGDKWTQTQFQCLGICPEVRNILNGKVSHVTPQVGKAAIELRCNNRNFQLIGRTRLECIDGRWNGKLPYCHKLPSCVRLQSPANGTLHGNDNSHSAEAKFTCSTGFDLFGASTLTCNKGVWSSRVPTCKAYCKKIRDPPNGHVFGSRFSHGQVVSFKCKHGYELGGDRTLRCVNGRWNSSIPKCKVMKCTRPYIPSNSRIIYPRTDQVRYTHGTSLYLACHEGHLLTGAPMMVRNYTTWLKREFRCIASCPTLGPVRRGVITHVTRKGGGEVEIKCHANYTLIGSSRLSCINGKWNDSIPSCEASCQDPGDLLHGNKIGDNFSHGQRVSYSCNGNYVLEGARTSTCSDGRWSEQMPSCRVPCARPGATRNGRVAGDFRHGKSLRFFCRYGYARVGSSPIKCIDGKWEKPFPVCKGICETLRNPSKGKVHGKNPSGRFLDGDVATFSCDNGYDLFGKKRIRCVGKKWDSSVPQCKEVADCGPLQKPDHGDIIEQVAFTYGNRIVFDCTETGYETKGSKVRTCQSDGTWSGSPTTCEIVQCGDPGTLQNGTQTVTKGYVYGGSVNFKCNKGYTLEGTRIIYCRANKQWSAAVPHCRASCRDPGDPLHGNKIGGNFVHGQKVSYSCNGNYVLEGARTSTCSEGRWSDKMPSCRAPCARPAAPTNGRVAGDFRHGKSLKFFCRYGYARVGSSPIKCIDGKWDKPFPVCKGICETLRNPSKGKVHGKNPSGRFLDGDVATFSCDNGYDLFGKKRIRCVDKKWDSSVPQCKGKCKFPGRPRKGYTPNGYYQKDHYFSHGSSIEYACYSFYTMDGSSTLHCNNGAWNSSLPSCKKSCNDPGYIGQGKRIGRDFSHGKVVTYECTSHNYSLLGKSRLTCHDGQWDSDPPRCKKSCAPLPPLSNGKIHNSSVSHEALISFSCNSGFQLQGPQQIKCLDGKWNESSPSCIGVCDKPGILTNGRVIGRNYSQGSVIKFECDRGYELRGSPLTTCTRGAWEGQFPECEICIQVGANFWGFWAVSNGARNYWRAMITRINSTHVDFALLLNNKQTRSYLRTDQVLIIDKVPSIGDVLPNSPVIANQFNNRNLRWYRTGHATRTSTTSVLIKFDDGEEKWVPLERVRLVSRPRFCFDVK